jgi:hypothetical protein
VRFFLNFILNLLITCVTEMYLASQLFDLFAESWLINCSVLGTLSTFVSFCCDLALIPPPRSSTPTCPLTIIPHRAGTFTAAAGSPLKSRFLCAIHHDDRTLCQPQTYPPQLMLRFPCRTIFVNSSWPFLPAPSHNHSLRKLTCAFDILLFRRCIRAANLRAVQLV